MSATYAIQFIHRLQHLSRRNRSSSSYASISSVDAASSISSVDAVESLYKQRTLRQKIDAAAFKVYGHWVKREEQQTRMTLFQNDEKQNSLSHSGVSGVSGVSDVTGVGLPIVKS